MLLLDNVQQFRGELQEFAGLADALRAVQRGMPRAPTVRTPLAFAPFFKSVAPVLTEIVRLPLAAPGFDAALDGAAPPWELVMLGSPLARLLGWAVVFWSSRGTWALRWLATYRREEQAGAQQAA